MNLPEKLAREIARVATVKTYYEEAGRQGAFIAFAMTGINAALEEGQAAAGSNDIPRMIRALKDLEGISE